MSRLWFTPPASFAYTALWKWDTLHPGLAWLLDINRATCSSESWAREGAPARGREGWSHQTNSQGASVARHTDPNSQSEDAHCYAPPPACVWGCAGWHGAGPVGTIRTATLTVSAFKTEMHLVPCEREGKEGTVHTVCRRERCRACGEAKRPTVVSPVTCLVYGTRWLILACSSRWCSPSRWELQTADHLVSAAELLLWSEETRIFKYMSPRQWCYLGEHYGVSRRCSLVGGSTSVGAGFESS